ncbi:MAG: helix-turn-helix domain-containing protein [Planctomycetaceae bacterium]
MEEKNMSQETLASLMGVSQPAISNMLNRRCRPQRRTIVRFAQALGVTEEELWNAQN